jgi:hypothetical protein
MGLFTTSFKLKIILRGGPRICTGDFDKYEQIISPVD